MLVLNALAKRAYERDDSGCPLEPSKRVREAAAEALKACCDDGDPLLSVDEVAEPVKEGPPPAAAEGVPDGAESGAGAESADTDGESKTESQDIDSNKENGSQNRLDSEAQSSVARRDIKGHIQLASAEFPERAVALETPEESNHQFVKWQSYRKPKRSPLLPQTRVP